MTDDRSSDLNIEIERAEADSGGDRGSGGKPPERRLEDELGRIDLSTTAEGYVEGRVAAIEPIDARTVCLAVALPHGPRVEFDLEKPIPWSEEFLLARIVEDVGYDAASIGHLRGETVYLAREDAGEGEDGWRAWLPIEDSLRAFPPAVRDPIERLLAASRSPRWRLVDPAERPSPTDDEGWRTAAKAAGAVLAGAVLAVLGAAVGAAGGFAVPAAAIAYAVPGLVLVTVGLALFLVRG